MLRACLSNATGAPRAHVHVPSTALQPGAFASSACIAAALGGERSVAVTKQLLIREPSSTSCSTGRRGIGCSSMLTGNTMRCVARPTGTAKIFETLGVAGAGGRSALDGNCSPLG